MDRFQHLIYSSVGHIKTYSYISRKSTRNVFNYSVHKHVETLRQPNS